MKIRYIGRHRNGVEVGDVFVEHDATAEFPDEVAKSLLRQTDQWEAVKAPPTKKGDDE